MFQGVYINLDRREDRRAHMERELARFGLAGRYARLRAIPDENPKIGCYRSHMKALQEARRIGGLVHILEDDSILSPQLESFLDERASNLLEQFDILFLDMWVDQDTAAVAQYQAALDGKDGYIALGKGRPRIGATSSYIVAPRFVGKLSRLLRYHLSFGLPIDETYDRLMQEGQCSVAVVVPFLTGVDLIAGSVSDIQPIPPEHQRMYVMLRTRFFVDRARQPAI